MLTIEPIFERSSLPALAPIDGPSGPAPAGFGEALGRGLQEVSAAEFRADAIMTDIATGGSASVHDLMVATTEAALATDLLVNVRDRALEAYHEIMRLQL